MVKTPVFEALHHTVPFSGQIQFATIRWSGLVGLVT
jgi:hypothetical protein